MNTVSIRMGLPYDKTEQIVLDALTKDAKHYLPKSSVEGRKRFSSSNQFGYKVAITAWLALIAHLDEDVAWDIRDRIQRFGLVETLKQSLDAANAMLMSKPVPVPWCYLKGSLHDKLQALRFLKRFSPIGASLLQEEGIASFLKVQERLWDWKQTRQDLRGSRLIRDIRDEIQLLISPFDSVPDFGRFTPGAALGCGPSLPAKADGLVMCDPEAFCRGSERGTPLLSQVLTGYPAVMGESRYQQDAYEILLHACAAEDHAYAPRSKRIGNREYEYTLRPLRERQENIIKAVPKSFKAVRLIAPEIPLRQWNSNRLATALENSLTKTGRLALPLHDQSVNCNCAKVGSIDSSLATIDQSSASDSISEDLFRMVFPDWYLKMFDDLNVRSAYTRVPGKVKLSYTRGNPDAPKLGYSLAYDTSKSTRIKLQTHLTSGNSLTFIHESILFAAIARVSVRYAAIWNDEWNEDQVDEVRAYGDDVIIPDFAAETFCDILKILAFVPNVEKSYWGNIPYRESCGEEWYCGLPVHSMYWPRKEIKEDRSCLQPLISLQHRMYDYPAIARYLCDVCRSIVPEITSHLPDTVCGDLWEDRPRFTYVAAPIDRTKLTKDENQALNEAVRKANLYGSAYYCGTVREGDDSADPLLWAHLLREKHVELMPVWPKLDVNSFKGNIGRYAFRMFIEIGPYYEDPFFKTLGISSPRHSVKELAEYHRHSDLRYEIRVSLE